MFKLLVAVIFAMWTWTRVQGHRQKKLEKDALSWPSYRARVISTQVSDRAREGQHDPAYWEGILTYSYTVPGHELEVGESRPRFYDEASADAWARALKESFVSVRVDPFNARRSLWLDEEGSSARAAEEAKTTSTELGRQMWEGTPRTLFAVAIFVISGIGAIAALCVQISCLRGEPLITAERNAQIFFGMHIGVVACLIGAQAIFSSFGLRSFVSRSRFFEHGFEQSGALKALSIYSGMVFLYAWVRMAASDGNPAF